MGKGKKHWSYSTGERGRNRVRAYEDAKSGILYVEFYELAPGGEGPRRKALSLGHRDRERAKQQADELAAKLGSAEPVLTGPIRLRELFDIYLGEVTPQKAKSTQRHDRSCAAIFLSLFGEERKASTLNRRDWERFIRKRRSGAIRPPKKRSRDGVGNRQIAYDLKWLLAVLNWATRARDEEGRPLLLRNPLNGLPLPKEESPNRPVMTDQRYRAMLEVAEAVDWRFRVALVLAHETGHRIKSIRELRWSDVDLDGGRIRWRGENDKIGFEHVTPLTEGALAVLRGARKRNPGIGEAWVLPAPADASKPCSRHRMRHWWERAEELAGLEHIRGLGWHGLRRKFATDLQNAPLKLLCELGGWKEPQTLLKCYQHPDEGALRKALASRDRRQVGADG